MNSTKLLCSFEFCLSFFLYDFELWSKGAEYQNWQNNKGDPYTFFEKFFFFKFRIHYNVACLKIYVNLNAIKKNFSKKV